MHSSRIAAALLVMCVSYGSIAWGQTTADGTSAATNDSANTVAPDPKPVDLARAAQLVIQRTNEFRRLEKRHPIEISDKLTQAARDFAQYLAKTNTFSHTADGRQPAERAQAQGYEYCIVAENIAYEFRPEGFTASELAKSLVEGWKESPEHRKNMLDVDVADIGVAVARSAETGSYYAVQMFGLPKSKAIDFEIVNESDATVDYRVGDQSFSLPPNYTRSHTTCRRRGLALEKVDDQPVRRVSSASVQPANGDRFVVVRENGAIQLKKAQQ